MSATLKQKDLNNWLDYISSLHIATIDLGLDRIQAVWLKLKLNPFNCSVITVAGTNGKGSCVAALQSIYQAAGYKVAAYTSPHMQVFNERASFCGNMLSDEVLIQAFTKVEQARQDVPLTYFEFSTLAILLALHGLQPDVLILEVGLGGRLDAVNIIDADVAIISSVDFDHMQYLGDTRELIAIEKAGIARQQRPLICVEPNPPATLLEYAKNNNILIKFINQDFTVEQAADSWSLRSEFNYDQLPYPSVPLPSAVAAVVATQQLQTRIAVDKTSIQQGLAGLALPGRFEQHTLDSQRWIFDVAHNPQAITYLVQQLLGHKYNKIKVIFGVMADKAIAELIEILAPLVQSWYLVDLPDPRAASGENLAKMLPTFGEKNWYNFSSVAAACEQVTAEAAIGDWPVVVCGSFVTVAQARQCLGIS